MARNTKKATKETIPSCISNVVVVFNTAEMELYLLDDYIDTYIYVNNIENSLFSSAFCLFCDFY